jgi:hypothetical protein
MDKLYAIQRPDGTIIQEVEDAKTWAWEACARVDKALDEFRTSMNPGWERKAIRRGYRCVEVEVVQAGGMVCERADDEGGVFATGCGEYFQFSADAVSENKFKFCPHGGKIKEAQP